MVCGIFYGDAMNSYVGFSAMPRIDEESTISSKYLAEERYGFTDSMPTNLVQFRQTHGRNTRNHEQYENALHFGLALLLM